MSQKILHIFFDVDMRNQHNGLAALASRRRVDVTHLNPLNHVMFINRAADRLKMYSSGGVLSYIRVKGGLDFDALKHIPEAFVGGDVEVAYNKALKIALKRKLDKD